MPIRHVRVEIRTVDQEHCDSKCNWWCPGFGGRGAVCSLFEIGLQQTSTGESVRVQKCREQEVTLT